MQRRVLYAVALAAATLITPAASAQAPAASPPRATAAPPSVEAQLAELNRSVQQLVDMMAVYLERQRVDLLIKRIELSSQRLLAREQELSKARDDRASVEEEVQRLSPMLDRMEEQLLEAETDPANNPDADGTRRMLEELSGRLKWLGDKAWNLDQTILQLESDLERQRRDVAAWEEVIDRELTQR